MIIQVLILQLHYLNKKPSVLQNSNMATKSCYFGYLPQARVIAQQIREDHRETSKVINYMAGLEIYVSITESTLLMQNETWGEHNKLQAHTIWVLSGLVQFSKSLCYHKDSKDDFVTKRSEMKHLPQACHNLSSQLIIKMPEGKYFHSNFTSTAITTYGSSKMKAAQYDKIQSTVFSHSHLAAGKLEFNL